MFSIFVFQKPGGVSVDGNWFEMGGVPELSAADVARIEAGRNVGIPSPEYSPTLSPRRGENMSPSPPYRLSPPPQEAHPVCVIDITQDPHATSRNLINTLAEDDMEMDLDDD